MLDEASMMSLQDMAPLLRRAASKGYKVAMIGDRRQLSPVGAGDPFRRLIEDYGSASLNRIRRQEVPWMREATHALIQGRVNDSRELVERRVSECLKAYDSHDRIHWAEKGSESREQLVARWFADHQADPDGLSLVGAYRNADVRRLNRMIRARRREAGELQDGIRIFSQEFAPGDRILFRRNDRWNVRDENGLVLPVQNGTLGTLVEADPKRLAVRLDNGKTAIFSPEDYKDIVHGYAVTLHKGQGMTVDRSYLLADRSVDLPALTVAMSRQRHDLNVFGSKEDFQNLDALVKSASRRPPPDLIRDYRSDVGNLERPTVPLVDLTKPLEPAVTPVPRQVQVDAAMQSLAKKLEHRLESPPPDSKELGRIHESVDRLAEQVQSLGVPSWSRFQLDRLRSLEDHLTHRSRAAAVLEGWLEGSKEECRLALKIYDILPPARTIPEPPELGKPASRVDSLPDPLDKQMGRLYDRATRYVEASTSAPRPLTPLVDHWARRGEELLDRLEPMIELARRYRAQLEEPWLERTVGELLEQGKVAADLEERILERIREVPDSSNWASRLNREMSLVRWHLQAAAADTPPTIDAQDPFDRWLLKQVCWDTGRAIQAQEEKEDSIPTPKEMAEKVQKKEGEIYKLVRHDLGQVVEDVDLDALLSVKDPAERLEMLKAAVADGSLGKLKGFWRRDRAQSQQALSHLITSYEARLKERAALLNELETSQVFLKEVAPRLRGKYYALHMDQKRAAESFMSAPTFKHHRDRGSEWWPALKDEDKALLPASIEGQISKIRQEIAEYAAESYFPLDELIDRRVGRDISLKKARRELERTISYRLERMLVRASPALLPVPVRSKLFVIRKLGKFLMRARQRSRNRQRRRDRDGGISR